ncbi:MAG: CoA pyrophosphatase [Beggiatoa sp. IS2]|nr:MAG: CoA pyrophosphatase [Beggiatoa sp. IS2]
MRNLIQHCLIQKEHFFQWPTSQFTEQPTLRPAAVLLPLVERPQGITVILTRRTEHLQNHGGQICFPGGTYDATQDENPIATALRETMEEIGLPPESVEVAGFLESFQTGTGFLIVPVVGFVKPDFKLQLDPFEVAEAFEVPLDFVFNPDNHQQRVIVVHNVKRSYYQFNYEHWMIWGATAGILINFYQRLSNKKITASEIGNSLSLR